MISLSSPLALEPVTAMLLFPCSAAPDPQVAPPINRPVVVADPGVHLHMGVPPSPELDAAVSTHAASPTIAEQVAWFEEVLPSHDAASAIPEDTVTPAKSLSFVCIVRIVWRYGVESVARNVLAEFHVCAVPVLG